MVMIVFGIMIAIAPGMMRDSGEITISIVGDIMLSRSVQGYLDQYGYDYPYEEVEEIFLNDDLTIGNLECPITDDENSADKTKRFIFRADVENAVALKKAGFDCLNLANNHSMDYLSGGLHDTMVNLEDNGLAFVGAAENSSLNSSYIFQKNGIKVGVLAYSMLPPEGFFYNKDKPTIQYISNVDSVRLEKDLASLECDFKIVYFHWGIEYQPYKSENQELMAKKAIDWGADLVVGAHPHVQQDVEIYNGKYIYYSLGNFVFDRQIPPRTDESVILQVTINKDGVMGMEDIPVKIEKAKPRLVNERTVLPIEDIR